MQAGPQPQATVQRLALGFSLTLRGEMSSTGDGFGTWSGKISSKEGSSLVPSGHMLKEERETASHSSHSWRHSAIHHSKHSRAGAWGLS